MQQPITARLALVTLASPLLVGAAQIASTSQDGTGIFEFAVCQIGIEAEAERLRLPDPIIKCGRLPGRSLGSTVSNWHAANDGHSRTRHRLRCDAVTTDVGYRENCYWEAGLLPLPRILKPLPLPLPVLEAPKRN